MRCVITSTWVEVDNINLDNIKKGQGTWRKGILGFADLTPLAIPSPQIMFIIIVIIIFDDMHLCVILRLAEITPW